MATKIKGQRDSSHLWISAKLRLATIGGGRGMLYYRLYYLDRFSGHIDHFREFEAEGDSAAIAIAESWANGRAMELWNRHRKLKRWEEPIVTPD